MPVRAEMPTSVTHLVFDAKNDPGVGDCSDV